MTPHYTRDEAIVTDDLAPLQATITVKLGRSYAAYIINTLLPCMLLEMIGFLTHAFPIKDFSNRCTATLSCLIVKAAFFLQVSSSI